MLLEAAVSGMGVALGRSGLCADDLAAGRLVRPFTASRPADYAYYWVTPEGHAANPRVQAFIGWLEQEAEKSRLVTAAA